MRYRFVDVKTDEEVIGPRHLTKAFVQQANAELLRDGLSCGWVPYDPPYTLAEATRTLRQIIIIRHRNNDMIDIEYLVYRLNSLFQLAECHQAQIVNRLYRRCGALLHQQAA